MTVLEYAIDYGKVETQMIRDCRMSGMPLPERIRNRPEILPGLEVYLFAFYDLSADRQIGMSAGRIMWTAIAKYAEYHNFDEEQCEFLFQIIPKLDALSLELSKHGDT